MEDGDGEPSEAAGVEEAEGQAQGGGEGAAEGEAGGDGGGDGADAGQSRDEAVALHVGVASFVEERAEEAEVAVEQGVGGGGDEAEEAEAGGGGLLEGECEREDEQGGQG